MARHESFDEAHDQDHPAKRAMLKIILLILFILSVPLLFLDRIYRIEEDLSHARLTLHAASALKTQSRQGRGIEEFLTTEHARAQRGISICG